MHFSLDGNYIDSDDVPFRTICNFQISSTGNGAIAAYWQAKAGVEPPFAGC